MDFRIRERHYQQVGGLVRRSASDVSAEFVARRADVVPFAVPILPAKPQAPSLVSSSEGAMDRLLLTIPTYAVRSLAAAYQDIFSKLPNYTTLIVLVHEPLAADVGQWLTAAGLEARSQIIAVPEHLHFSVWAEDGYAISTDTADGTVYFVEPFYFPRYGDSLVADFVSNATDLRDTQSPVYFQGGNILIGDDFFLIGADYPANSLGYLRNHLVPEPGEQPVDLVNRLYREYLDTSRNLHYVGSTVAVPEQIEQNITIGGQQWKEILYLGNKPGTAQPLFHIDMFLTLAGRGSNGKFRILVGDPGAAATMLGMPLLPQMMQPVFDNIARGLERMGFEIIRNPLPLVYVDDTQRNERVWYFATSNNAWVQNSADKGKIVWLPTYGYGHWGTLAATDQANADIWSGLGYEVRQVGDFHPFAENLGALHCIAKYLGRS